VWGKGLEFRTHILGLEFKVHGFGCRVYGL